MRFFALYKTPQNWGLPLLPNLSECTTTRSDRIYSLLSSVVFGVSCVHETPCRELVSPFKLYVTNSVKLSVGLHLHTQLLVLLPKVQVYTVRRNMSNNTEQKLAQLKMPLTKHLMQAEGEEFLTEIAEILSDGARGAKPQLQRSAASARLVDTSGWQWLLLRAISSTLSVVHFQHQNTRVLLRARDFTTIGKKWQQ